MVVLDDVGMLDIAGLPTVQALAAQGTSYTRAYGFPVCSPSRYASMFGALPRRVGMGTISNSYFPSQSPSPYAPRESLSIAEAVKPTGRATALFGKWHLGRPVGLEGELFDVSSGPFVQGWDTWRAGSPDSIAFGPGSGYYDWDRVRNGDRRVVSTYATDLQANEFLAWWAATPAPRLAWLATNAAHAPYDTPPGYPAPGSTREAYEAVLAYADSRLADVLAGVDLGTTFVLLVGDNGTPDDARPVGSQSGIWKGTTREGGVRVPFILAGPGVPIGTDDRLVSLLDVPATLCDLLGVQGASWPDSASLCGPERAWVFTERYSLTDPAVPDDRAVIETNWKLRVIDPDGIGPALAGEEWYWVDDFAEYPIKPGPQVRARLQAELASVPPRL